MTIALQAEPPVELVAKQHKFAALDALRGVAAACVMLWHIQWTFGGPQDFGHAQLAVDLFFILSGFVISHSYAARLKSGAMTFGDYVIRRIVRLYPLIALGTAIGLAHALAYGPQSKLHALILLPLGLAAIPVPSASLMPLDPPSWSLFFEMFGSVAFGLLIPA